MKISIPKLSLVVLIGPSGSGKSTFARKHFLPTEVLSSDACRGMVSDDENNQAVTNEAFAAPALHRRPATGSGPTDCHRCHERAARVPQAAGRACPQVPLPSRRHRAEPARTALPGSQPALGTSGTSAPTSFASSIPSFADPSVASDGKASAMFSCWKAPKKSKRPRSSGCRCGTTDGRNTAPSTSSATFTAAATNLKHCSHQLGYQASSLDADAGTWGNRAYVHPAGSQGSLRRRSGGPWPSNSGHRADRPQHGRSRLGPVRARQPRHEADAEAPGQGCSDHARPGAHPCGDRRLARRTS